LPQERSELVPSPHCPSYQVFAWWHELAPVRSRIPTWS